VKFIAKQKYNSLNAVADDQKSYEWQIYVKENTVTTIHKITHEEKIIFHFLI
jgi:hypothetical protein